jgi:uncharacterized damage-inducible protein DinB
MTGDSIRPFYADWAGYNRRVVEALGRLAPEDLALVGGFYHWPIWAIAAHTVAARVFWLCNTAGEPGAETTPFSDPSGFGWEDDLSVVRSRNEIVDAYDSTWRIVAGCLERWTPEMLGESIRRQGRTTVQLHTRQSLLLRLITHEAYHAGEISTALSENGREPIDLWPPGDWVEDAPVSRREG